MTRDLKQIPTTQRLVNGARLLGNLWRQGQRCENGWSFYCECEKVTKFCVGKNQWHGLLLQQAADPGRPYEIVDVQDRNSLLLSMTSKEFEATKVTLVLETAGGQRIRIGPGKTDLRAFLAVPDEAMQAVETILKVFPDASIVDVGAE